MASTVKRQKAQEPLSVEQEAELGILLELLKSNFPGEPTNAKKTGRSLVLDEGYMEQITEMLRGDEQVAERFINSYRVEALRMQLSYENYQEKRKEKARLAKQGIGKKGAGPGKS